MRQKQNRNRIGTDESERRKVKDRADSFARVTCPLVWYPEPKDFKPGSMVNEKDGQIKSIRYDCPLILRREKGTLI